MRFVHRDEPAWIRADLAALRSHAVLGTLFDVVEGHADPLSESVRTGDELLVFTRSDPLQTVVCAFNLGGKPLLWTPPNGRWSVLETTADASLGALPPYSAIIAERLA